MTNAQPGVAPSPVATTRRTLSTLTKATYGLGDFASNLVWTTTTSYLAVFYTDTVGIAAGVVAVLLLVARVLDAIVDLAIGALAERTRSKYGRFRPWILYGLLPLAVMLVLTFSAPFPGGSTLAAIWAAVTYGILGIVYSVVNVPYGALAAVMSESPKDRVGLNSWRIGFTQFANVLLAFVTIPVVVAFSGKGDGHTQTTGGYTLTALVFAVVAVFMLFAVFARSKEAIRPVAGTRIPLKATLRVVFSSGPLALVFVGATLVYTSFFGRLGVVIYYFLYDVRDFALLPLFLAIPSIAAIIGIIAFTRFATRLGKRNLLIISLVGQGLSLIALYLVGFTNTTAILIISAIYGLSQFALPLVISMIPDVVDVTEDRTGVRADGTFYATISFSTKLASAIGGSLGVALLATTGFVANAQQSQPTMEGINAVVNLAPAVVALVGIVPFLFYRVTEKRVAEARARLDERAETTSSIAP